MAPRPAPFAPPRLTDEGLIKGVAANARGDFYRAVLLLKDAADRIAKQPGEARQAAWAHAHLAWAYVALKRNGEAEIQAQTALRFDSALASVRDGFPDAVVEMFKRPR